MRNLVFCLLFLLVGFHAMADELNLTSKAARDLNAESLRLLKVDLRTLWWLLGIAESEVVTSYYDFDDLGRQGNLPSIKALVQEGYVRTRTITRSDEPRLFARANAPSKYLSITPTEKGCAVMRTIYGEKFKLPACPEAGTQK